MRQLEFSPRFKRDFEAARRHLEYSREDLLQLFYDLMYFDELPAHYREHTLEKRARNWSGFTECHLGVDLVVIYVRRPAIVKLHRIGSHTALFAASRRGSGK